MTLLPFLARAMLAVLLLMTVLFVWRAWRRLPGLAILAGALAAAAAVLLFKSPALAAAALAVALVVIVSVPREQR
jgi:hypothetical protein